MQLLLSWQVSGIYAQRKLEYKVISPQNKALKKILKHPAFLRDSIAFEHLRDSLYHLLLNKGFFDARLRQIPTKGDHFILEINTGPRYTWSLTKNDSTGTALPFKKAFNNGEDFDLSRWEYAFQGQLKELVEDGYPFAELALRRIQLVDSSITGQIYIDKGKPYFIRGVQINGTARISDNFMRRYLGMEEHVPFSHSAVKELSNRIDALPFVRQQGIPIVRFYREYAEILIHLDPKPANNFDILLGIAQAKENEPRRFNLTGHAKLSFHNLFGRAEKMALDYRGLPGTQSLDILAEIPYIMQTALGAGGRFKLYYKANAYTETNTRMHLSVDLTSHTKLYVIGGLKRSRIENPDTNFIKLNHSLPPNLDYKQSSFGLKWSLKKLDYEPNPLSGWDIDISASAGQNIATKRAFLANPGEINIDSLYELRNKHSLRWSTALRCSFFLKLQKRMTLHAALHTQGLFGTASISDNELFRLGGGRSLRGFDEEQFRAERYLYSSLEYRFLTSKNGYLAAFADYGWLERYIENKTIILHPLGIGLGFVFETKGGIFQLQYAVGKIAQTAFDFTNGQVHLGYLSRF